MNEALASSFENRSPLALSALVLGASWVWLFWTSIPLLLNHWNSDDYSYCYLVPLLAAYLAYHNRGLLKDAWGGKSFPGYLGLLAAALFFLAGRLGSLETLVYLSMWLSIASIPVLLVGSGCLRALRFPLLVLFFAIPLPPFLTNLLTFKLRLFSSTLAVSTLHLLGVSAYREGNIIDVGFTQLQVVDACSGLRYLFPTVVVALVMGYLFNRRFRERLVLVVAAVPVSLFINAMRIVVVVLLAKFVSAKFGEEGFLHDLQGWFIFMVSVGVLLLLSVLLRRYAGRSETTAPSEIQAPAVPAVASGRRYWVHGLIAALFLVALHFTTAHLVGAQATPPRNNFSGFPMTVDVWEGKRIFLDQKILDSLWADDYVTGTFFNRTTGNFLQLLVSFYDYQTTYHTAHAPTSCLLGGGWSLLNKRELPPNAATGRTFPVQQMVMEKDGRLLLSNFWFQQRGRIITSEYLNKWYLFWDALTRNRTDGALVRVEMTLLPGQNEGQAQEVLDRYTVALRSVLKDYIPD